jgi:hypothetical protein
MSKERAVAVRRLFAFAVDWFVVVVLWGGVLCCAVIIANGGKPPQLGSPWAGQAISFLTITLPFTLYLAFGSALLRNAVKFTPWEFGHFVTWQSFFLGEEGFPAWLWGPATIAFAGPVWWLASLIGTGRTPYDRWAFARVGISAVQENRSGTAAEPGAAAEGGGKTAFPGS